MQPFSNFCRICCENGALKEALKLRTEEVKTLKAENASKTPAATPLTYCSSGIIQDLAMKETFCWDKSLLTGS